jgi:uncharacterized DUF497 family protein
VEPFGKLQVEWDSRKAASNFRKHGVSFDEAKRVLEDALTMFMPDKDHAIGELRYRALGQAVTGRTMVIICAEDGPITRILSARIATAGERRIYERG